MNNDLETLDINSAGLDELIRLPGIGANTAEKIIAGRPYASIEELRGISGIGKALFERIAPVLYAGSPTSDGAGEIEEENPPEPALEEVPVSPQLETAADGEIPLRVQGHLEAVALDTEQVLPADEPTSDSPTQPGESESQPETSAVEMQPEALAVEMQPDALAVEMQPDALAVEMQPDTLAVEMQPEALAVEMQPDAGFSQEKPASPVLPEAATTGVQKPGKLSETSVAPPPNLDKKIYGVSLTCGLFAIMISIALTLGILYLINNSLRYVHLAEFTAARQELAQVSAQASSLSREIQTLTTRLDNLESIAGRVATVEQEIAETRSEMEALTSDLDSLGDQIGQLDQQVEALEQSANQFTLFLEGLRELLGGITQPPTPDN